MIGTYIIAMAVVLAMLTGWVLVQHAARMFAARHPEFGPAREEGEGCGGLLCLCKDRNNCPKRQLFQKTDTDSKSDA